MAGERNFGLDVVRTLAIYYVVLGHGLVFLTGSIFSDIFEYIYIDGVELFFVLSGFLIGSILIRMTAKREIYPKHLLSFWIRRWFRTLPLYYIFLGINAVLAYHYIIEADLSIFTYKFFLFLQNFNWYFFGFFNESWSLAVEEWFYLLFPPVCFGLCLLVSDKRAFAISVFIFIFISILYRVKVGTDLHNFFQWDYKIRKLVLTRLDAIMWGVLAARGLIDYPDLFRKYRYPFFVAGLVLYFVAKEVPGFPTSTYYVVIYLSIASFALTLLLPAFFYLSTRSYFLKKFFTFSSTVSYSMYLIHGIVLSFLLKYLPPHSTLQSVLVFLLLLFLTNILSAISYRFIEKPLLKLRDHKSLIKILNIS